MALLDKCEGLGLSSPCSRLVPTSVVGLRRQHCLVAMALLVECEGLRSPCGRLMTTLVVGLRHQHCLVAAALLVECEGRRSPSELGHISPEQGQARSELGRLLAGASSSSLLAGGSSLLVEKLLEGGSLLAPGASGFLIEELLATALVLLLPFLPWKGGTGCPGGGCDHLICSHTSGLEREDECKWAGGDPPFPICGGYGRGF
jgi:hypothetical protein